MPRPTSMPSAPKKEAVQAPAPSGGNTSNTVQNAPPKMWKNFDQFWNACIKNGGDRHKEACKIHLKSLGWLDKPDKWIDGVINFGIKVEK